MKIDLVALVNMSGTPLQNQGVKSNDPCFFPYQLESLTSQPNNEKL